MSRVRSPRRAGLALLLALACAAALWALASGREPRNGGNGGSTSASTGAPRDAGPAAADAGQPAATAPDATASPAAPPTGPPMGPIVPGSTLVESHADGTQVLDGIPCQVRQPDGTMSSHPVRITVQPAAVVPVEDGQTPRAQTAKPQTANAQTGPGHK